MSKNENKECKCHKGCPCGADCVCTEDNHCSPECKCWEGDTAEVTRVKKIAQKFRAEAEAQKKQASENLSRAKYERAELENFRKRNANQVENAFMDGQTFVIMNILPVLDSMEEAEKLMKNDADREGVAILARKFDSILTNIGLELIVANAGDEFNPHVHSAVSTEDSTTVKSGAIIEVWQKGYKLGGKVIRPSSVKIAK